MDEFRRRSLDPESFRQFEEHIAGCPACEQELQDAERIAEMLRIAAPRSMPDENFFVRSKANVRERVAYAGMTDASRGIPGYPSAPSQRRWRNPHRIMELAAAFAAGILATSVFFYGSGPGEEPQRQTRELAQAVPQTQAKDRSEQIEPAGSAGATIVMAEKGASPVKTESRGDISVPPSADKSNEEGQFYGGVANTSVRRLATSIEAYNVDLPSSRLASPVPAGPDASEFAASRTAPLRDARTAGNIQPNAKNVELAGSYRVREKLDSPQNDKDHGGLPASVSPSRPNDARRPELASSMTDSKTDVAAVVPAHETMLWTSVATTTSATFVRQIPASAVRAAAGTASKSGEHKVRAAPSPEVELYVTAGDSLFRGENDQAFQLYRELGQTSPSTSLSSRAMLRAGEVAIEKLNAPRLARDAYASCLQEPLVGFFEPATRAAIGGRLSVIDAMTTAP
jgi:hypothetical protein